MAARILKPLVIRIGDGPAIVRIAAPRRRNLMREGRLRDAYCLEPIPGRPKLLAILNRTYRAPGKSWGPAGPLSVDPRYHAVARSRVDLSVCKRVENRYYLYGDGTAPWLSKRLRREYEERLASLFARTSSLRP